VTKDENLYLRVAAQLAAFTPAANISLEASDPAAIDELVQALADFAVAGLAGLKLRQL
jgi:hypothetical protein